MNGIRVGYRLGHNGRMPHANGPNLPTTPAQKEKISRKLVEGVQKGCMLGPFTKEQVPIADLHCSPLGAIPKGTDGIRPIFHLSYPRSGVSINSEISDANKTVVYTSFRDVVKLVLRIGRNGYLWICDAEDAYLRVPVHKDDWKCLGIHWMNKFIVVTSLYFGIASACKIYTEFADCIEWATVFHNRALFITQQSNEEHQMMRHYLDDFFGGAATEAVALQQFKALIRMFDYLGIPTRDTKCKAPAQCQKILGFEYDTRDMKVRIPSDKVQRIKAETSALKAHRGKVCAQRIKSLIGLLRWASQAIFCGNAFVRRLEYAVNRIKKAHFRWTLPMRNDMAWWDAVIESTHNGFPLEYIVKPRNVGDIHVWTDASGTIGFGGFSSDGAWYQYKWDAFPVASLIDSIVWKELLGLVVFAIACAPRWRHRSVVLHCDNRPVVEMLKKKHSSLDTPHLMHLIRKLCEAAVKHQFYFWVVSIDGKKNVIADALSRFFDNPLLLEQSDLPCSPISFDNVPVDCLSLVNKLISTSSYDLN